MFLRHAQKYAARYLPILCAILLLLTCSIPASAGDEATVDELFEFLIDEWVKPVAVVEVDYLEVRKNFIDELKSARTRFGHLAEYWELRAHVDFTGEDMARILRDGVFLNFSVQNDYYLQLNPEMLERALERDPNRPAALWNLGRVKALDSWPEWNKVSFSERYDAVPEEFVNFYIDGLADAAAVDPDNGYYPFFEASMWTRLGDTEKALGLFEQASQCERFYQPAMFPTSYALEVIEDFNEGAGIFEGLSLAEREILSGHFYFQRIVEDVPGLRRAYKFVIEDTGEDWQETYNILNSAACRFGKFEGGNSISQLTALVLISLCHDEALIKAKETGDRDLEIALLAMWHEAKTIQDRFRMERNVQDRTYLLMRPILDELLEFKVDPSNIGPFAEFINHMQQYELTVLDLDWMDTILTDLMTGVVDYIREDEFSDKFTWHIFGRIELFDYNDPLWWYVWWEAEGRNSTAKDDTNYRGICKT